jgi:hypothetical protein
VLLAWLIRHTGSRRLNGDLGRTIAYVGNPGMSVEPAAPWVDAQLFQFGELLAACGFEFVMHAVLAGRIGEGN